MSREPGFRDGPLELKLKKWKVQWTIVKGGFMQYFDTDKFPEGQRPLETIKLRGAKLRKTDKKESKRDFAFVLVYGKDAKKMKELYIAAKNQDDLHAWVRTCQESIQIANPKVYGVDLSIGALKSPDKKLPVVVSACLSSLARRKGAEGIFRVSGSLEKVNQLKDAFDTERTIDLSSVDVHVVSGALKLYLRELPDPLLTFALYEKYLKTSRMGTREQIIGARELFGHLPVAHRECLLVLLKFVHDVSRESAQNMMSTLNLATVFGPTIMRPERDSEADAGNSDLIVGLTDTMISHWEACCGLIEVPSEEQLDGVVTPTGGAPTRNGGGGGGGSPPKTSPRQRSNTDSKSAKPLPKHGWKEYVTKEGRPYYYHKETKKTSWKRPPEMGEPEEEEEETPHHTGPQFNLGAMNPAAALENLKRKKVEQEAAARKAEQARQEVAEKAAQQQAKKPAVPQPVRKAAPVGAPVGSLVLRNNDMSVKGRLDALDTAVSAMETKQKANYDLVKAILAKLEA